jgi:hypothetical protein
MMLRFRKPASPVPDTSGVDAESAGPARLSQRAFVKAIAAAVGAVAVTAVAERSAEATYVPTSDFDYVDSALRVGASASPGPWAAPTLAANQVRLQVVGPANAGLLNDINGGVLRIDQNGRVMALGGESNRVGIQSHNYDNALHLNPWGNDVIVSGSHATARLGVGRVPAERLDVEGSARAHSLLARASYESLTLNSDGSAQAAWMRIKGGSDITLHNDGNGNALIEANQLKVFYPYGLCPLYLSNPSKTTKIADVDGVYYAP